MSRVETRLDRMASDIDVLRTDVPILKSDVAVLKTDVAVLKTDVAVLRTDVAELRHTTRIRFEDMDTRFDVLTETVRANQEEFTRRFTQFEARQDERMDFLTRVLGEHARRIKDLEDARHWVAGRRFRGSVAPRRRLPGAESPPRRCPFPRYRLVTPLSRDVTTATPGTPASPAL
jgi:chromosome segregation ATPase